jgi:hypothetical protein
MTPKKIIILLIITLLFGTAASMLLQDLYIKHYEEEQSRNAITENPFYDEFQRVGKQYGLNMEFTKNAGCMPGSQLPLDRQSLLSKGPKSCDVLLVGDSSMAWGLIPEVVEQMTGLVMGTFTTEALILNVTTAKMIQNLATYYLKDDGLLILSFGGWTQEQNANSMVLAYPDFIYNVAGLGKSDFKKFIEQWRASQLGGNKSMVQRVIFSEYRKSIGTVKNKLAKMHFSLLQLPLYAEYIEPVVNPKWYKHKKEMKEMIKCYLRWNNRSIVMYAPGLGKKTKHSDTPYDPKYRNKDVETVSAILNKIPCRKAYQIHITFEDPEYVKLRSIYNVYYRNQCGLIDLGVEHPVNEAYELDEKGHTINSGGFYQSILIGKALKKDFEKLGKK